MGWGAGESIQLARIDCGPFGIGVEVDIAVEPRLDDFLLFILGGFCYHLHS
jgi:hypothetical protein